MKHVKTTFLFLFIPILFVSCSKELLQRPNTPTGVFNSASNFIEDHYSMFDLKQINWTQIHNKYESRVSDEMSEDSLLSVCKSMIYELQDAHCYISTNEGSIYVYDVIRGYTIDSTLKNVLQYITEMREWGSYIVTGIINQNIGYINYAAFGSDEADQWQEVFNYMASKNIQKLIFDIRNNGGGDPLIAQTICGHFVLQNTTLGTMHLKSGKGPNDFHPPFSLTTEPKTPYFGNIPVILLTNRASYSAASYLTGMTKALPNVTQVGQITGGGGGGPLPYELPNGWVIGITNNYFLDIHGQHIELGVEPEIEVINTHEDYVNGTDRMLETAISL